MSNPTPPSTSAGEYMYILTMKDGTAVSCTAWLDLYAHYGIIERVHI